jgi:lipoate-protein ligase A
LCSFDLSLIPRYLVHPPREPDYRKQRGHLDFVANVNAPQSAIKERIAGAWDARQPLSAWPERGVEELMRQKYGLADWHRRR